MQGTHGADFRPGLEVARAEAVVPLDACRAIDQVGWLAAALVGMREAGVTLLEHGAR